MINRKITSITIIRNGLLDPLRRLVGYCACRSDEKAVTNIILANIGCRGLT